MNREIVQSYISQLITEVNKEIPRVWRIFELLTQIRLKAYHLNDISASIKSHYGRPEDWIGDRGIDSFLCDGSKIIAAVQCKCYMATHVTSDTIKTFIRLCRRMNIPSLYLVTLCKTKISKSALQIIGLRHLKLDASWIPVSIGPELTARIKILLF